MSGFAHTPSTPLRVVHGAADSGAGEEHLAIPPSPQLKEFLAHAASSGLKPHEAVRLGVERALVLRDSQLFDLDVESARGMLRRAAAEAQISREIPVQEAAYLRGLSVGRPAAPPRLREPLVVHLPAGLLIRAKGTVAEAALHRGAVGEMILWERAARLEGRSMSEWALKTLGLRRSGSRAAA